MGRVKPFIVLPMTSLYLPVMPWSEGTDDLVTDSMLLQVELEHGWFVPL